MKLFIKKNLQVFYTILFTAVLIIGGCKHPPGIYYNDTPSTSNNCNADTVYFQNDILPLLNSSCAVSGCHNAVTGEHGVVLTDYGSVMRTGGIDIQNPAQSSIYRAIVGSGEDRMPPAPAQAWTSDQAAALLTWISQGAINNACVDLNCDTTNVTFSGSVQPIFQTYCLGCHSGTNPSGGIDLTNFNTLSIIINNGALLGSIKQEAGYIPMPQGSAKLSDCNISTIEIWARDTVLTSGGTDTTSGNCNPDTVYFQNTVLPLLQSNCAVSGCHDAITHKEGVQLTDYTTIINTGRVVAGNPYSSKLYTVLSSSGEELMPPPPRTAFTTDQKDIIKNWILQGALNNECTSGCDTTNVTFSSSVFPIIQTYCTGCHTDPNPGGGVYLRNYSDLVVVANNGKLWGSINHEAGYSAMPKNANKLSDCNLATIKIWINDGTPNN